MASTLKREPAASLREAVVMRDEEEGEAEFQQRWTHGLARLDLAAEMGAAAAPDLLERLRAIKHTALGQPSKPFHPPIQIAAADAIEALERGGPGPDRADLLSLASRLMGFYGVGPLGHDGRPEFGHRITWTDALGIEAAGRICVLAPEVGVLLGVASTGPAGPEQRHPAA